MKTRWRCGAAKEEDAAASVAADALTRKLRRERLAMARRLSPIKPSPRYSGIISVPHPFLVL
jgi:hypothetical protein